MWNTLKESTDGRSESQRSEREREENDAKEGETEKKREREREESRRMRIETRHCWSAQSIHPTTDSNRSKATVRPDGWFIRPVMSFVPVYLTFPFVPSHTLLSKLPLSFNFLPAGRSVLQVLCHPRVSYQTDQILIIKLIKLIRMHLRIYTYRPRTDVVTAYISLYHPALILIKIIASFFN